MSQSETAAKPFFERGVEIIEAASNLLFYLFALLILVVPPLKWLADVFPSSNSSWMVALAALVFGIVIPSIAPLVADSLMTLLQRIREGKLLARLFRPFKAVCAVLSIYAILTLEYKVLHSQTDKSLLEVFFELLKSL